MITKQQAEELAGIFQIDGFTIAREYLQLVFLSHLYQEKDAGRICFKGGTAIRLLFGSPRFSEDLDFSTLLEKQQIAGLITKLETKIRRELPEVRIVPLHSGRQGIRFRLVYASADFKYPLVVRLDFNQVKELKDKRTSLLATRFPITIFPLVWHLTEERILTEKINAVLKRSKGRDVFDIWFLLSQGVPAGKIKDRNILLKRVKSFPQGVIEKDLVKFLPRPQRAIIPVLKDEIVKILTGR